MEKKALITGVLGQDGSYLSRFLLDKGYKVYGAMRRSSTLSTWRLDYLKVLDDPNFSLVELDLCDQTSCINILKKTNPHEVYNLAAQSFVGSSFEQPIYTSNVNAMGVLYLLEAIKNYNSNIRFYQASTSEMFGKVQEIPQTEQTPFYPRSPYGVSKLYAHWITKNYQESYDLFATSGILFNHESPLRGYEFVTKKITSTISKIKHGLIDCLEIGNLEAKRDWGYALDYVEGMWMILNAKKPSTYILATGETHTVREFIETCCVEAGFEIEWKGSGLDEQGFRKDNKKLIVKINPNFYRPAEVDLLIGSYKKINKELGWKPKMNFNNLVKLMYQFDENELKDKYGKN